MSQEIMFHRPSETDARLYTTPERLIYKWFANISLAFWCLSFNSGVLLGLHPFSLIWFSVQLMIRAEPGRPECCRSA